MMIGEMKKRAKTDLGDFGRATSLYFCSTMSLSACFSLLEDLLEPRDFLALAETCTKNRDALAPFLDAQWKSLHTDASHIWKCLEFAADSKAVLRAKLKAAFGDDLSAVVGDFEDGDISWEDTETLFEKLPASFTDHAESVRVYLRYPGCIGIQYTLAARGVNNFDIFVKHRFLADEAEEDTDDHFAQIGTGTGDAYGAWVVQNTRGLPWSDDIRRALVERGWALYAVLRMAWCARTGQTYNVGRELGPGAEDDTKLWVRFAESRGIKDPIV